MTVESRSDAIGSKGAVDPRRVAWAYLSKVVQGPCPALTRLVEEVGPEEAARAVRERDLSDVLGERTVARAHVDTAVHDLELVAGMGGRLVTPDDDEWPQWRLLGFGNLSRSRDEGPPLALWVLGSRPVDELTDRAISIVGTRAASGYGEHVTAEVAGDLAVDGWTVVSGAAFGVDGSTNSCHSIELCERTRKQRRERRCIAMEFHGCSMSRTRAFERSWRLLTPALWHLGRA